MMMLSGVFPRDVGKRITPVKEVKKTGKFMMIVFFILIIYSVFLPLKLGTIWFFAGLGVYATGLIISFAALFSIAATKPGEPFTTGMYRYSRHPLVLGTILPLAGAGIASASWLFLLLVVTLTIISRFSLIIEERATVMKFGDSYKRYMAVAPRWIGLPRRDRDIILYQKGGNR